MNITQVKAQIKSKNFLPVYIFTGEEIGVMNIYINQIAKVSGKSVYRADTFKEVFQAIKKKSVVNNSYVYVIRDDKEVVENEKIWELIKDSDLPFSDISFGDNIVILVFTTVDKRTKFYKQYKDTICEFEPLDAKMLTKYIQKEISLSEKNCQKLIEVCESSYSRIMLEIDKIKNYALFIAINKEDISYDYYFGVLCKTGVIYKPARDVIFIWSDAVMSRKDNIWDLTKECFGSGEATLTMLSVLYNNVKQTLQLQTCDGKDISKSTGLTGWQIQCVKKFVGKYTVQELLHAMKVIRSMETGIKTGKVEEQMAIPFILVNML